MFRTQGLVLALAVSLLGCKKKDEAKQAEPAPAPVAAEKDTAAPAGNAAADSTGVGNSASGGGEAKAPEQAGCLPKLGGDAKVPDGDITLTKACGNVQVSGEVTINAKLTIEPGVTLTFDEEASLYIGYSAPGALIAVGTAEAPIVFTGKEKSPGSWKGIFIEPRSKRSRLENVRVEYAGDDDAGGALRLHGEDHVIKGSTFQHGKGVGILVDRNELAFAAPLEGNTFEGFAKGAVRFNPRQLGQLGANTYKEKQVVEIASGYLESSATLRGGVTHRLLGELTVQRKANNAETPILTIEPGAIIEAASGSSMHIGYNEGGSLKAVGTADKPIRFTSFDKLPGSWEGIRIYPAARGVVLEHVIVEYADSSDKQGAIRVDHDAQASFKNVHFENIDGYGLQVDPRAKATVEAVDQAGGKGAQLPNE